MGRGLSDLQKWILIEASKVPANKHQEQPIMPYNLICAGYYGWQDRSYRGVGSFGEQHFSKAEIGALEYQRVMATISRACRRLEERNLVLIMSGAHSHWTGVALTENGREWVSVNSSLK